MATIEYFEASIAKSEHPALVFVAAWIEAQGESIAESWLILASDLPSKESGTKCMVGCDRPSLGLDTVLDAAKRMAERETSRAKAASSDSRTTELVPIAAPQIKALLLLAEYKGLGDIVSSSGCEELRNAVLDLSRRPKAVVAETTLLPS